MTGMVQNTKIQQIKKFIIKLIKGVNNKASYINTTESNNTKNNEYKRYKTFYLTIK